MRTVKSAEVRRNEILDAAEELFVTQGFEQTTTNDILEKVGIARGTLYYHFKSKEEILDAMIMRINRNLIDQAKAVLKQKDLPVFERLTRMLLALQVDSEIGGELIKEMHKPQNALLHQKMQDGLLEGLVPLMAELIDEGMEQHLCQSDYPIQTVRMILVFALDAFDDRKKEGVSQADVLAFIANTERMLAMKEGSLTAAMLPVFTQNQK